MKNKFILGTLGIAFALSAAIPAFAATPNPSDMITRLENINGRIETAVTHFQDFSNKLASRGQDTSTLNARMAMIVKDHENAQSEIQKLKDVYATAGNTVTPEVKAQALKTRDAIKAYFTDAKTLRDLLMPMIENAKANHPTQPTKGNVMPVSGTPVSIPATLPTN